MATELHQRVGPLTHVFELRLEMIKIFLSLGIACYVTFLTHLLGGAGVPEIALSDLDMDYLVGETGCPIGPGELKNNPPLACVGAPSVAGVACVPKTGPAVCCKNPVGVTEQDTGCIGEKQDVTKASHTLIYLPVPTDCADRIETQCECKVVVLVQSCRTKTINHGKCGTKDLVPNCAS